MTLIFFRTIDFHKDKKYYGSQWNLIMFPNILQTIFFCVPQKKVIHKGLYEGEQMFLHGLSFWFSRSQSVDFGFDDCFWFQIEWINKSSTQLNPAESHIKATECIGYDEIPEIQAFKAFLPW